MSSEKNAYLSHFEQFCTILNITYDNLTLSEVIEGLFLPHAQNDCKIAVSSSSQSLIEFIYLSWLFVILPADMLLFF